MFESGEVISYLDMCQAEEASLQRGMNFRMRREVSVLLMSQRPGAVYTDRVEDQGRVLVYQGHDAPQERGGPDARLLDQPVRTPSGGLTQNGLFFEAALAASKGRGKAERVRVYEKIRTGIWVFNGTFHLVDAWTEAQGTRSVFKFKLVLEDEDTSSDGSPSHLVHSRLIPSSVKLAVWQRDKGACVLCGSRQNLHFDHVIPFAKGGSSLVESNIQLLCASHNLAKRDRIE